MPPVEFRLHITTRIPSEEAWRRLWDLRAHGAMIPFTRLNPVDPLGAGSTFTARTAIGRLGFDDPMQVVRWEPPESGQTGRAVVVKTGRVILGRIDVTLARRHIHPAGQGAVPSDVTHLIWRQRFGVGGLPARLQRPAAWVAKAGYALALRGLLRRSPRSASGHSISANGATARLADRHPPRSG